MKTIIIYFFTIFFGFIMQVNQNNNLPLKVSIELPDTIYTGQRDIPIILKVENTSSEVLSIRNPAHWGNAHPFIKQEGKNMSIIKVKINPKIFNDIIHINGNEFLRIKFDYTLDKLFNLEYHPSGKYDIFFELYPDEKISFKSDVFTFCIQ